MTSPGELVPLTWAVSPGVSGVAVGDGIARRTTVLGVPDGCTFRTQLRPKVLVVDYRRHVPSRTFTGLVRAFRREGFPVVVEALGRPGWRRAWIIAPEGGDQTEPDELRAVVCALLEDDDAAGWHDDAHAPPPLVRPVKGWAGLVSPATVPEALAMLATPTPDVEAFGRMVGTFVPANALRWLNTHYAGASELYSAVTSLANRDAWSDEAIVRLVLSMPVGGYMYAHWRQGGTEPRAFLLGTVLPKCRRRVADNPAAYDPSSAFEQIGRHRAASATSWSGWPLYRRSILAAHHRLAEEQGGGIFGASERDVAGIVGCDRTTVRAHRRWLAEEGWLALVDESTGRDRSRWNLTYPAGGNIPPRGGTSPRERPTAPVRRGGEHRPTTSHLGEDHSPSIDESEEWSGARRTALEGGRRPSPSGYDGPHDAYRPGALGVASDTLALLSEDEPLTDRQLWERTPGELDRDTIRDRRRTLLRAGLVERRDGGWVKVEGWRDLLDPIAEACGTAGVAETVRRRNEVERAANLERLTWGTLLREGPLTCGQLADLLDLPTDLVSDTLAHLHEVNEAVHPHPSAGRWEAVRHPTTTFATIDHQTGETLAVETVDSTPGRSWVPPHDRDTFTDELADTVLADMQDGQPDT